MSCELNIWIWIFGLQSDLFNVLNIEAQHGITVHVGSPRYYECRLWQHDLVYFIIVAFIAQSLRKLNRQKINYKNAIMQKIE